MIKIYSILITSFFFTLFSQAQTDVTLRINHMLNGQEFQLNQSAVNDFNQSYKITRMSYYISRFTVIHDGGQETAIPDEVIALIKCNNSTPFTTISFGSLNVTAIEGVKFHIGVYDPINLADPGLQPAQSPLAPQNPSMHWGWAFGYRFLALEGTCGANFSQTYQFHGLGSHNYFERSVIVQGTTDGNGLLIDIDANYEKSMATINLEDAPVSHGIDREDLTALENFRDEVFSPRALASISTIDKNTAPFIVYPNPSNSGVFNLEFDSNTSNGSILVRDNQGRTIQEVQLKQDLQIKLIEKGIYFITHLENNAPVSTQKVIFN